MADLQEKVQKLHEIQLKAQTELNSLQQKISESNADRRGKVERLVKQADDAMTKAFNKNIFACIEVYKCRDTQS